MSCGPTAGPPGSWPTEPGALSSEQVRVAALEPEPWRLAPSDEAPLLAGCFVAFARGEQGPGRIGDHAWTGAVLWRHGRELAAVAVAGRAGAPYSPGYLAAREGPLLAAAVAALPERPDALLVDATGRDHPRRAGLALHLGAVLEIPTVGVTHRPLVARGHEPGPSRGALAPLTAHGEIVAQWVRTVGGVRPAVAHAAWRTDAATAAAVVLGCSGAPPVVARTPEPLRLACHAARTARAAREGGGVSR
ncbi:MAG: endonuclease V [Acidimicrobiia bacterium]|nr:endonuclease V [Acidimicrobiia bacterium]